MVASARKISRINDRERQKEGTVTVTLKDLMSGMPALSNLASQPLRAKHAFRLSKIIKAANAEMEECEKQRKAILERTGFLPEGENVQAWEFETPEKRREFDKEFEELLTSDVTLAIAPLKIDEIADLTIASADLAMLHWMLTE